MKKIFFTLLLAVLTATVFSQPSGSVTAFAGPKNKLPSGWVVCDGKLYDRTNAAYTRLFNAIGVSWGGDGGNKFAVPDLRGQFLRGVTDTSTTDPEANDRKKSRTDLNSSGNGGNAVGSKQSDEVKPHDHPITDPGHAHPYAKGGNTLDTWGSRPAPTGQLECDHCNEKLSTDPQKTGITKTELSSGKETRPKNAYVYFIIDLFHNS